MSTTNAPQLCDVVFEQHYRKKFDSALTHSAQQAFSAGVDFVLAAISDFESRRIPVTARGMRDYLSSTQTQDKGKDST